MRPGRPAHRLNRFPYIRLCHLPRHRFLGHRLNSSRRVAVVASLSPSMAVMQELALADVNGVVRLIRDEQWHGNLFWILIVARDAFVLVSAALVVLALVIVVVFLTSPGSILSP